jgi:excisionase family DNA binding protein
MSDSLRPSDIAERWQCKEARIYKLIREGRLRAFRLGKLIRVPIEAVEEFEENRHEDVPPKSKSGYVYFVGVGGSVKIGFARNVERRLTYLRAANHESLVILHVEDGTAADEARLHNRFSHLRRHSEWFSLSGELAEYLKECSRVQMNTSGEHLIHETTPNSAQEQPGTTKSP